MNVWPGSNQLRSFAAITAGGLLIAGLAACGSSPSGSSAGSQVAASAKQTIVFATQGLGTEGTATANAVKAFEKIHPNIKVTILSLSPTSDVAEQQLEHYFIAGSSTPDVVTTDVTWPSTFARSGWIANLTSFHPATSSFFAGQMATGSYNGGTYAMPWFINAEGLYYNTSMIKTAPTSIAQLVSEANAAVAAHKSLKEGLAFEGDEYEGSVTAWQSFGAQIGLKDLGNIDTPANVAALTFMYDAIHTYKIAPSAVTGWQESNVQAAWLSGQTPFALNWPYIYQLSESTTNGKPTYPAVYGKTAWIPFPSATPQSSLGGDDLAINAKSTHKAAAYELIQYLTSVSAQDTRAIFAGDPPSVTAAYNSTLYKAAPYYENEKGVYAVVTPRPVTPVYPTISSQFQTMISSVLSGQSTASAALGSTAPTVKQLYQTGS
ncbi:MAG TPA: extracellular solute-binding protein [Streptosporangiaceae bacterium]|nr:extracellular solute-binding protein [Streptosporangiaceae bacterium]